MMKRGVAYYVDPSDTDLRAFIAAKYAAGLFDGTTQKDPSNNDQDEILAINPAFRCYGYLSTDAFDGTGISAKYLLTYIEEAATLAGIDIEECFIHYDAGITIGWDGGDVTYSAGDRVRAYADDRILVFPWTAAAKTVVASAYLRACQDSGGDPVAWFYGLFLDNCSSVIYNTHCNVVVTEAGYAIEPEVPAFNAWMWTHRADFLKNYLLPALHGAGYKLCINSSSNYASDMPDCADILFREGDPNTFRMNDLDRPNELATQAAAVAAAGGKTWWPMIRIDNNIPGLGSPPAPDDEQIYAGQACALVVGADNDYFGTLEPNAPSDPNWMMESWIDAFDVIDASLGAATSAIYLLATGTDSLGQTCKVWARDFAHGIAMVSIRRYDHTAGAGSELATGINGYLINPDGTSTPVVDYEIQKGRAVVILTAEIDSTPPDTIDDLEVTATSPTSITLFLTTPHDDTGVATLQLRMMVGTSFLDGDWATATAIPIPTPGPEGTPHSVLVTGLAAAQTYSFRARALDAIGNESTLSAVVVGVTDGEGEPEPPPVVIEDVDKPDERLLARGGVTEQLALLEAELDPLYRGLRTPTAWEEYADRWADEYDLVRGADEADFMLRIRLFNAIRSKNLTGTKIGLWEWLSGTLDTAPIFEEAFRGHWAWFPGMSSPGMPSTYAIGVDTFISHPFVWDLWLFKTSLTDLWGTKTPLEWMEKLVPFHSTPILRIPVDPWKLVHIGRTIDAAKPWIRHALSEGSFDTGMMTTEHPDAPGYLTVSEGGVNRTVTYTSPEIDLGLDYESWNWFPDFNIQMKRYRANFVHVYHRSKVLSGDDWTGWEEIRPGHVSNHFFGDNARYHQFKVEVRVERVTDFAISTIGLKALSPADTSIVYADYDEGAIVWGGGRGGTP